MQSACTVKLGENALEILGVKHHGRVLYFLCLSSQRALADRCEVSGLTSKNLRWWHVHVKTNVDMAGGTGWKFVTIISITMQTLVFNFAFTHFFFSKH